MEFKDEDENEDEDLYLKQVRFVRKQWAGDTIVSSRQCVYPRCPMQTIASNGVDGLNNNHWSRTLTALKCFVGHENRHNAIVLHVDFGERQSLEVPISPSSAPSSHHSIHVANHIHNLVHNSHHHNHTLNSSRDGS